jgi:hypothetical protein
MAHGVLAVENTHTISCGGWPVRSFARGTLPACLAGQGCFMLAPQELAGKHATPQHSLPATTSEGDACHCEAGHLMRGFCLGVQLHMWHSWRTGN